MEQFYQKLAYIALLSFTLYAVSDVPEETLADITETISRLREYRESNVLSEHELHEIEQEISEYETMLHKGLKNKTYGCLLVKKNLVTNNLKVCNDSVFNNITINGTLNGTFDLCGVSPCDLADGYSLLLTATSGDIPNTLVMRDGGSFAATTITLTGALQFQDSEGNNIQIEPASITEPYTLVLPDATGTAGQFLSILSASGDSYTLGWASAGAASGTPNNTPNTLVMRNGTGSFSSSNITLTGCLVLQDSTLATAGTLCANTVSVMLVPYGARALQASSGGNTRGTNAVDLQMNSAGAQVASGAYSVITGGQMNTAAGDYSVVSGGLQNNAQAGATFVGAGQNNNANGFNASILAGLYNSTTSSCDAVVSGSGNSANGTGGGCSIIGGGIGNSTGAGGAFIGGGLGNSALNYGAVVCGGGATGFESPLLGNNASGISSFIGGGVQNSASITGAVVVGGGFDGSRIAGNSATGVASFVGGGIANQAINAYDSVVSGSGNSATGGASFVGGGQANITNGPHSIIGGGQSNTIAYQSGGANYSFIGGGQNNAIQPFSANATIGGGANNTVQATEFQPNSYGTIGGGAGNTVASGSLFSFIGGGYYNVTSGYGSAVVGGGNDGSNPPVGNQALGTASFVGGGIAQTVSNGSAYSGIVSGSGNTIGLSCSYSFIGGGQANTAASSYATIGGGIQNNAAGSYSFVGGGWKNRATNVGAVVVGGGTDFTEPFAGNAAVGPASFVGGGIANTAGNVGNPNPFAYDAVVSGSGNTAQGGFSFVGSGQQNQANALYGFVGNGYNNVVNMYGGAIVGGGYLQYGSVQLFAGNTIDAYANSAFIGAGMNNKISQFSGFSAIVSGSSNVVNGGGGNGAGCSFIGSGANNNVSGFGSSIVSGGYDGTIYSGNTNAASASFIGSGLNNSMSGNYSAIVSGSTNSVDLNCPYGFIGSGNSNQVQAPYGFVGGGYNNQAAAPGAVIVGGGYDGTTHAGNYAKSNASFIGGGINNIINFTFSADNAYSAIVSGSSNSIGIGTGSIIGGGTANTINGGYNSVIPGGMGNTSSGSYSFVAGQYGSDAGQQNSFVWSDGSAPTNAAGAKAFTARAAGGYTLYTSASNSGAQLASGATSWTTVSDKNKKRDFEEVDHTEILEKVAQMPIEKWSYQSQDASIRHMGPYAQDFYAAFGLGENPLGINTVDIDGVSLAAIKGMYLLYKQEMGAMKQEIAELKEQLEKVLSQK